ncbi:uncharacterized protein At5g50100, chloroplastic [Andrographis paniculata]|uniref:uncharacterized protein At5g50100, chloroplastic n=1 Tax=Andrographis paniculata TaxID=175694 RepID=UPI0021E83B7A|nr:uncharacterized protein At5g50100, chloroplastic [Andrographis paniculata]
MALRSAISLGRQARAPSPFSRLLCIRSARYVSGSSHFHQSPSLRRFLPGAKISVRAINEAATEPKKEIQAPPPESWEIKMLYDGDCPLCMREVNMLRERNQRYGTIKFVDISSDSYSPDDNQGLDYETVMGRIHAVLSDGTVVTDVEAFRKLYEAVGLGWVYAVTKYEPIASIADSIYGVWAKYRLQVTGRPPLEQVLEMRKQKKEMCKESSDCKV